MSLEEVFESVKVLDVFLLEGVTSGLTGPFGYSNVRCSTFSFGARYLEYA